MVGEEVGVADWRSCDVDELGEAVVLLTPCFHGVYDDDGVS